MKFYLNMNVDLIKTEYVHKKKKKKKKKKKNQR